MNTLASYAVVAGIAVLAGVAAQRFVASDHSEAIAFLAQNCGVTAEPWPDTRENWESLAANSAIMNRDRGAGDLAMAMEQLRLFEVTHPEDDKYGELDQVVNDRIWQIAGRAAHCGAAYGAVNGFAASKGAR